MDGLLCKHCDGTGICKQAKEKSEYKCTGEYAQNYDEDPIYATYRWYSCPRCGTTKEAIGAEAHRPVCMVCNGKGYLFPKISNGDHKNDTKAKNYTESCNLKKIFLVHGHDRGTKAIIARFLEKLNLEAVILHEKPNEGQTVIEKFEKHADVSFAVVLLTPDDLGASKNDCDNLKPRARQNVIFELGYFISKLGRNRVCGLYMEGVEIPSDYQAVLYIPVDTQGAWKLLLAREMKKAGIEIDFNIIV